ncbi:hypothetical protein [Trichormus azollae]|uniref:hypothetical protein n=1 Tax=Trichormus azollae TaxID=1164 RepID=UPI00325FC757
MLDEVLDNWQNKTPADILTPGLDGTPLVVESARYNSNRGGSQEDDRTGENRDKIIEILSYSQTYNLPLKALMLNDGAGLILGCMWDNYTSIEKYGQSITLSIQNVR